MPVVGSPITQTSPLDEYPVTEASRLKGGLQTHFNNVGDWTNTSILPAARREAGMIVSAKTDPTNFFVLGEDLLTWSPLSTDKQFENVDSITAFASTANVATAPKFLQARQYWTSHPGIGGAFWRLDASSTRAVGPGCKQVGASGPGRYVVVFENGLIDVTKLGARPAKINNSRESIEFFQTTTNAAFKAAATLQQDQDWPDKMIWVPNSYGVYQITETISNSGASNVAFHIKGASSGTTTAAQRVRGAAVIRQMTTNIPIIEVGGFCGSVSGLTLEFENSQSSANTNGVGIRGRSGENLFYWLFYDLTIHRTATAFQKLTGGTMNNCTFEEFRCVWFTIAAFKDPVSGTCNKGGRWYIQNSYATSPPTRAVTNITKAGLTLTITLAALPANFAVGSFFELTTADFSSTPFFVKTLVGNVITVDMVTDVAITATTGTIRMYGEQGCTEPMVQIGDNSEWDIVNLDIEVNGGSGTANQALALDTIGMVNVGYLHMEYMQPNGATQTFIRNRGILNIGIVGIVNIGLPSTRTMYMVTNEMHGSVQSWCKIDAMDIRDVANLGGQFILARSLTTANKVILGDLIESQNFRANSKGSWPYGDAVTFPKVTAGSQNAAIGQTGVLSVISGALQVPSSLTAMTAVEQGPMRHVLGIDGAMCISFAGTWGHFPEDYSAITEGTSVTVHRALRACTDIELAYSGLAQRNSYANPAEKPTSAYEVIVSICRVDTDFETEIGTPVWLRFRSSGRYWHLVRPGGLDWTEKAGIYLEAGDYVRILTYCNRLKSDTTNITTNGVTETGQLTADAPYWPRHGSFGGGATTNGKLGSSFQTGSTITPASWNQTDGGSISIGAATAVAPTLIIARPLDAGAGLSTAAPIAIVSDSIGNGSNDLERTDEGIGAGRGYMFRAFGHTRPLCQVSVGGQRAQYLVDAFDYNWKTRGQGLNKCLIAWVHLGTNDLINGRSASQVQADLTVLFTRLRARGIQKIITGSILPRTNSTDAWETTGNQSQQAGGFDTAALAVNTWLAAQVGIQTNYHVDFTTAMTSGPGVLLWKQSTGGTNYTVDTGASDTVIPVTTPLTVNALRNNLLMSGSTARRIASNTTSAITVSTSFGFTPAGTVRTVRSVVDFDGVHPTGWGHADMATVVAAASAQFNL